MTVDIEAGTLERFRAAIVRSMGLHFDDSKLAFLDQVLRRRLDATKLPADSYVAQLAAGHARHELGALAGELTVPETYFFRHLEQLRAFAEIVLPDRLQAQAASRRLRILSAGSASGEEAYSLAIILRETLHDPSWSISILGIDVNPAMIQKARRGHFSPWALRGTPEDVKQRWLRHNGRDFVLDESLRQSVRFEEANLMVDDAEIWAPETYDVIFCRNVLMYFEPECAQALVARMGLALAPGGYLFLGHAETLRGLSTDFHLRHTHGTFYYQRKDVVAGARVPTSFSARAPSIPAASLVAVVDGAGTWVDAIREAAERINSLTKSPLPASRPVVRVRSEGRKPGWDLGLALELVRKERFSEALEIVRALPPESGSDPDVLLLHAVLLTHAGELGKAQDACMQLLTVDELSAGAHYLLALCKEGVGERDAAAHQDQVAAYLDPGFAMPRLHLGLLARRSGDLAGARRELAHALALLQREDASRILLFGGGFGREALVSLCRAELIACGGTP